MQTTTVKGMILSVMPIGEYDRRLEILTDSLGRISAFARGSRKPSSPLVSCGRVFAFGEFELYEGRSAYSVNAARISNYFEELSSDVMLAYYGYYFLELAAYFTREGLDAKETLKLVYQSLRALSVKSLPQRLVRAIYELKILELNGICPSAEQLAKDYDLHEGARTAADFVKKTPIEKLYTFVLTGDAEEDFLFMCASLIKKTCLKDFKSLDVLETLS